MKILQTVKVKQVLTDKSKQVLLERFKKNKQQLQKECDQLLFEMKKLEKSRKYPAGSLKKQFDKEIALRKEKIKVIDFQLDQLEILPIGSEILDQELQAITEINVGDQWDEVRGGKTIIVKDGIITEIRER